MARKPRQKAEPKASLEQLIQGRGVHIGFGPDGDVMVSDLKGEMTDDPKWRERFRGKVIVIDPFTPPPPSTPPRRRKAQSRG